MRQKGCSICGRAYTKDHPVVEQKEYTLSLSESVCELCGMTLARGFAGIVEMLRQSHGERRERVLDRLMARLETNGFSTDTFPKRRRTA